MIKENDCVKLLRTITDFDDMQADKMQTVEQGTMGVVMLGGSNCGSCVVEFSYYYDNDSWETKFLNIQVKDLELVTC